jgi:hypothetical protein
MGTYQRSFGRTQHDGITSEQYARRKWAQDGGYLMRDAGTCPTTYIIGDRLIYGEFLAPKKTGRGYVWVSWDDDGSGCPTRDTIRPEDRDLVRFLGERVAWGTL